MPHADPHSPAELIWSLHRPLQASVGECLARWEALDRSARLRSYLVLHGEAGQRRTLTAPGIAALASAIG